MLCLPKPVIILLLFLHAGVKCVGVRSRSQPSIVLLFIVYTARPVAARCQEGGEDGAE